MKAMLIIVLTIKTTLETDGLKDITKAALSDMVCFYLTGPMWLLSWSNRPEAHRHSEAGRHRDDTYGWGPGTVPHQW